MLGRGRIVTFTLDLLRVCVRMMLHSNSRRFMILFGSDGFMP
ncbi:hypothetical protein X751_28945 [Mesorhizobium sp. LNJC395A00]|nr:hypothetical protein X752_21415 [Mesorhizobium sp. LNJC398B00]ESY14071.1 hypothetical protein X751_28945 [Mesorhizobium sp. LNJC395A00]ESY36967.1 hypothetical protein X746_28430 [Mesorhizobium sp. LNJC380A00]